MSHASTEPFLAGLLLEVERKVAVYNGSSDARFSQISTKFALDNHPRPWLDVETYMHHEAVKQWTIENRNISIWAGLIYLILLAAGRRFMKDRQPFSLRKVLTLWNVFMAIFSLIITVRVMPYFIKRAFTLPLYNQVCLNEYQYFVMLQLWHDVFVLTKPIEFIDTLFIVLRKQHLHFLHYYHHITVVILCWFSLGVSVTPPNSIFYVALNAFVHSVMYTYYGLRSVRIRVPRMLQMSITLLQIAQMVIGMFINVSALWFKSTSGCDVKHESIYLPIAIYGSYFYLFAWFFYDTYLVPKSKPKQQSKQEMKKVD